MTVVVGENNLILSLLASEIFTFCIQFFLNDLISRPLDQTKFIDFMIMKLNKLEKCMKNVKLNIFA